VEWVEGSEGIPWIWSARQSVAGVGRDLAGGGGWGKGRREERGGRREEVLCEIGSGSGLGFGTGDLVLFGARVWD
jgi:hypothetical protein